jgi:hypothetical protein
MSQEPRVRLVKDGNVVGIVWEDNNGDLVLEESEGGNELRVTSVSAAAEIIDADELRANDTSSVTLGNTLDADNNDVKNVDALDSNSVNTDVATSTEPITVYVDPNGDDNNDGLSADNPKQTIKAAVQDAPLANNQQNLTVSLASGTYAQTILEQIPYNQLVLTGPSDQSAVIDGANNGGYALDLKGGYTILENLEITGGAGGCVRSGLGSAVWYQNCYIHGGGERALQHNSGSVVATDEDTLIDQRNISGGKAGVNILSSWFMLRGTFRGTSGGGSVLRFKEGSRGQILGTTIDADSDDASSGVCINLLKNSYAKIADVTLENAASGVSFSLGAFPLLQNDITLNNIDDIYGFDASFYAVSNGAGTYDDQFFHLPSSASLPTHWDAGAADGVAFFDNSRGVFRWYSDSVGASDGVEAGRVLIDTGTTSVPAGGQTVVNWTGPKSAGVLYDAVVGIADPDNAAGDAEVDWHINWDDGSGHQELVIEELGGSNGVDVQYRIHEIPQ